MPPSVPTSAIPPQKPPQQRKEDVVLAGKISSVEIWLDGLETRLPLREEPTRSCLTGSRAPLGLTQPKLTPHSHFLRRQPEFVCGQKRKRSMDGGNHDSVVEPRRSCRINKSHMLAGRPQEDGRSHSEGENARDRMSLPRRRGKTPKNASRTTAVAGLVETKSDTLENTTLPLRDTPNILGGPALPPPLSPTRSGTTRTSGSSPSRANRIKRDHLMNCTPQIKFETIAEAKKHLPHHVMQIRKDILSPLLHEQRIVPPVLKVSANSNLHWNPPNIS
jgi:hypothetical protein